MKVKQKKVPKKDSHITVPSSLQERRKIKLKLNLKPFLFTNTFIQETKFNLVSTPTELCSTADMEKYTNGIETTYLNTRVDGKGNTFFKFSNNLIFKKGNKILSNGQQGEVDSVTAYTPHQTRSYHLVKKTGKEVIKREVSFLRAMNKSMGISLNSIQKIVHWQGDVTRTSYYSRYEKGGDLKLHQPYIQEQYHLNDKNVLSYLFSIMMQLAEGLSVLHDSQFKDEGGGIHFGIVHNDLKPANIFVKENGHIVIADFGCAYFADEAAAQYGSIFFTDPNLFLHSEEFSKKPLKNATKSDIWSLGLMFEVLLNGKLPAKIFNSDNHIINDNLPDTLESYINLKDWAKLYDQSNRCKKVREARDYLIMLKRKVKVPIDITNQKKILESFVLVMQLPIEERPTSKELKEYLLKFAHCFGTIEEREEKSKLFASQLMLNMEKLEINSSKTLTTSEDSNEEDEHMLSFRLCR